MMKKMRLLGLCGVLVLTLSACGDKEKSESSLSGTVVSGSMVSGDIQGVVSGSQYGTNPENTSGISQTGTQLSGVVVKTKEYFPVELCNKIITFNQCIIAKAPIENQPVMKEQLIKVLEPWKLLAETQLREVCQQISVQENFLEVVKHYETQGCKF